MKFTGNRASYLAAALPWGLILALAACNVRALQATEPTTEGPRLAVTWRLIDNFSEGGFAAELRLQNIASQPLGPPWSLYFNTAARLDSARVKPPFALEHLNGDFYRLGVSSEGAALAVGESLTFDLRGQPWAISASDAPRGFYLVARDPNDRELPPVPVPATIEPFPSAEKIRRGGGDRLPVVTAAARFAANAQLTKLPRSALAPVIPTPIAALPLPGSVVIDGATVIECPAALKNEATQLAEVFARSFGIRLAISVAGGDKPNARAKSIRLALGDVPVGDVSADSDAPRPAGGEAYTLDIAPERGIAIVGTDAAGVFYGIQSLRALAPIEAYAAPGQPVALPAMRIVDAPRFGYRGLHLDVARNFQSVETVKQLLELMAFYKLNRFHFHLTDDEGWRLAIAALPELTTVGSRRGHTRDDGDRLVPSFGSGPDSNSPSGSGYYTREQFIELLQFAHRRHIVVIPEIDMPGHSRAAVKAMAARAKASTTTGAPLRLADPDDQSKYESVQAWHDNVIDAGREDSYQFVGIVLDELAAMYRAAGVPLEIVHLGGDEVPRGAWEGSPAVRELPTPRTDITRGQQLEIHFLKRVATLVAKLGATPACWDDCIALTTSDTDWTKRPIAYVWNSVWGWGREEVAYRLANAGVDVVLSNATHLYFDLAVEKDPTEPGYYWAGFVATRAPFEFNPLDIYQCAQHDSFGKPLPAEQYAASERLTATGRRHILGIQGQLWAENLLSPEILQYMAFPRTIALAERAWAAEPEFARQADSAARDAALASAWNQFANALGQRELSRLHEIAGKVAYRIPPPGVALRDGMLQANVAYPGLTLRFTTDGAEPRTDSPIYSGPLAAKPGIRFRAFDQAGHASRSEAATEPPTTGDK